MMGVTEDKVREAFKELDAANADLHRALVAMQGFAVRPDAVRLMRNLRLATTCLRSVREQMVEAAAESFARQMAGEDL